MDDSVRATQLSLGMGTAVRPNRAAPITRSKALIWPPSARSTRRKVARIESQTTALTLKPAVTAPQPSSRAASMTRPATPFAMGMIRSPANSSLRDTNSDTYRLRSPLAGGGQLTAATEVGDPPFMGGSRSGRAWVSVLLAAAELANQPERATRDRERRQSGAGQR